jgi:hypothetical protein
MPAGGNIRDLGLFRQKCRAISSFVAKTVTILGVISENHYDTQIGSSL